MQNYILKQICRLNNSYFPNSHTTLRRLQEKTTKVFYISKNRKVVGYCILSWPLDAVTLTYIGVVREYRKKHIGSRLIKRAIKWCTTKWNCPLFTYTSIYNTVSMNMLIKNGFLIEYATTRWVYFRIN